MWPSGAQHADFGLLLTRTDSSVPKHAGLTAFFIDMRTPGIEVRPIRQANGMPCSRVPDENRLGKPGEGWQVALHTLMNERLAVGRTSAGPKVPDLLKLVNTLGPVRKAPYLSQRIADLYCSDSGARHTVSRVMASVAQGRAPGPEASVIKFTKAWLLSDLTFLMLEMQGTAGVITDPDLAPFRASAQAWWLRAPGEHIGGGTDEILLTVIGERVLGLPPDVRSDKEVAFKDLPH